MIRDRVSYKLGLALSGGGARGFAHIGALKAMEERDLRPDILSGTSVGALIAVFYAAGYTAAEIMEIASTIKFTSIVEGIIPRGGFFKTTGIQHLLEKHLRVRKFEDLPIPVRVVASDIALGRPKVFAKGDIIPAVMASCSVPIVFTPVQIDGHHYVDGGLLMNFPVSVIRRDCRTILGVDISPVITLKYEESLKYVIERSMNYMVGANTNTQRKFCDYLIECKEVSQFSIFDFKRNQEIYNMGYELACIYLDANQKSIAKDLAYEKPLGLGEKLAGLLGAFHSKKN